MCFFTRSFLSCSHSSHNKKSIKNEGLTRLFVRRWLSNVCVCVYEYISLLAHAYHLCCECQRLPPIFCHKMCICIMKCSTMYWLLLIFLRGNSTKLINLPLPSFSTTLLSSIWSCLGKKCGTFFCWTVIARGEVELHVIFAWEIRQPNSIFSWNLMNLKEFCDNHSCP